MFNNITFAGQKTSLLFFGVSLLCSANVASATSFPILLPTLTASRDPVTGIASALLTETVQFPWTSGFSGGPTDFLDDQACAGVGIPCVETFTTRFQIAPASDPSNVLFFLQRTQDGMTASPQCMGPFCDFVTVPGDDYIVTGSINSTLQIEDRSLAHPGTFTLFISINANTNPAFLAPEPATLLSMVAAFLLWRLTPNRTRTYGKIE